MPDINIGLTQFLDFTLRRSGRARTRYVREIKYTDYHPARDYWKRLRDEIINIHSSNESLDKLDSVVNRAHQRQRNNYMKLIGLYKSFFDDKEIEWFDPGKSFWSFQDTLNVRSNPELGLYIDGKPHIVKLYFKGERETINKHNIASTLTLMNSATFNQELPMNTKTSVLNIRRERMHSNNFADDDLLLSLEGDAQQLIYLWNNV